MKFCVYLVLALAASCNAKIIAIDKFEVDVDPTYIKISPKLHEMDGINVVDIDCEVLKDEPEIQYQATVFRHNVDHFEHFHKSAIESGCTLDSIKDPLLIFMFKESMKYGNLTAACPIKVGHYQLRNFKIETSDMPHELAAGSYRFEFSAFIKKDNQMHDVYTDRFYFKV